MTLLIINGNVPCCDCKGDTGIPSLATNLFNENEVYCYSCSSAMLEEDEIKTDKDDVEPETVRMPPTYPQSVVELYVVERYETSCLLPHNPHGTSYMQVKPRHRSTIGVSLPISQVSL